MTNSTKSLLDGGLDVIEQRAKKAPAGPWFWRKCYQLSTYEGMIRLWALKNAESEKEGRVVSIRGGLAWDSFTPPAEWDADPTNDFIAHSRTDIPALCDAVRDLAKRVEELERAK